MQCFLKCFLDIINGIEGIATGYLGIGLTYVYTGLLERERKELTRRRRIASMIFLFSAASAFIVMFARLLTGWDIRQDIDSPKIMAFLAIGTGLLCGSLLAHPTYKKIAWPMFGTAWFFLATSLILLYGPSILYP